MPRKSKRIIPASNFMGTIAANIDGAMTDKDFRQFIRNTLPLVIYDVAPDRKNCRKLG